MVCRQVEASRYGVIISLFCHFREGLPAQAGGNPEGMSLGLFMQLWGRGKLVRLDPCLPAGRPDSLITNFRDDKDG